MSLESYAIFGYEWEALEQRVADAGLRLEFKSSLCVSIDAWSGARIIHYDLSGSALEARHLKRVGELLTAWQQAKP